MDNASEDRPLDPAGMLDLVERQQDHVVRSSAQLIPWILFTWAVAWTLGYIALWLVDGLQPTFSLPSGVAAAIFFGLTAVAIAASAVLGPRSDRGVQTTKDSAFTGTVFGVASAVALTSIFVLGVQLTAHGMPPEVAGVYFPAIYTLVVGVIYLMAGAVWRAVPCVVLGAMLVAVALVAGFFPYPSPYLVVGLAGGGVFLGGWVVTLLWVRGRGGSARR
ncbi:hypothetical protein AB0N73_02490 [Microbacterium sp. NPDC089189]|uniref:hypothetical protein n=1 Tax=Microbacterium sp. NPDC089189 TaxID=3154972 RepID=UPI003439FD7C